MGSLAIAFLLTMVIVVVVRAVLLPLCGRLAIWHESLCCHNDIVEIGDLRGRVVRIGLFHTFLAPIEAHAGKVTVINNADVFRRSITVEIRLPDWGGSWNSRR